MKTLLEQAKELRRPTASKKYTEDHYDLAIAWLKGQIGQAQASKVLGTNNSYVYVKLATILKEAVIVGYLKIETKKEQE